MFKVKGCAQHQPSGLKNQRGSVLIIALIAAAMSGVIVYASVSQNLDQVKLARTISQGLAMDTAHQMLTRLLTDAQACSNTLAGKGTGDPVSVINKGDTGARFLEVADNSPIFDNGTNDKFPLHAKAAKMVRLANLELIVDNSVPSRPMGQLQLRFARIGTDVGGDGGRLIDLNVQLDGSGDILECYANPLMDVAEACNTINGTMVDGFCESPDVTGTVTAGDVTPPAVIGNFSVGKNLNKDVPTDPDPNSGILSRGNMLLLEPVAGLDTHSIQPEAGTPTLLEQVNATIVDIGSAGTPKNFVSTSTSSAEQQLAIDGQLCNLAGICTNLGATPCPANSYISTLNANLTVSCTPW